MIDVHAHFADEGYEFPAEWDKIRAAGVNTVILAGDTLAHCGMHRDFANKHAGAYFTVGVHPEFAGEPLPRAQFLALGAEKKCVAVGEIGLDYHYDGVDRSAQRKLFCAQLELAAELDLPVQIHSRDACADTLAILREAGGMLSRGALLHCYSYGAEPLESFLSLGAYISLGGVICFKNARRAVEAAEACPLGRLLSETDSPYLNPLRGEKNSPANIPVIVEKLAEIKGVSFEEMKAAIRANAEKLFEKIA